MSPISVPRSTQGLVGYGNEWTLLWLFRQCIIVMTGSEALYGLVDVALHYSGYTCLAEVRESVASAYRCAELSRWLVAQKGIP